MDRDTRRLYDLTDPADPAAVQGEIVRVLDGCRCTADTAAVKDAYALVVRLFQGTYPGYRASNTKYHDLEHTSAVTLATLRLLHALALDRGCLAEREFSIGLTAALFHDTGLIQTSDDTSGSGAKYTLGHEARSIAVMRHCLANGRWTPQAIEDCAQVIQCTDMTLTLERIPFRSERIRTLGQVVGSADLLAQMADPRYPSKLPLLWEEFCEAGLPGFRTELELLEKTDDFYHEVARRRLVDQFDGIADLMHLHFKERWGIDRDLYAESIAANLARLRDSLATRNERGAMARPPRRYRRVQ